MNEDLLQQLRDIHEPAPPGWWPPAPGWWLLLGCALAAAWFAYRWWRGRQVAAAPYRAARGAFQLLDERFEAGQVSKIAYLDQANELLKRILIHVEGFDGARAAHGDRWLQILANRFSEPAFLQTPGLGSARYVPDGGEVAGFTQARMLLKRVIPRALAQPPSRRLIAANQASGHAAGARTPASGTERLAS